MRCPECYFVNLLKNRIMGRSGTIYSNFIYHYLDSQKFNFTNDHSGGPEDSSFGKN